MENYIDLHMHSLYSLDGEFKPSELVKKCFDSGIKIMAITDHNYVKAIKEEQETCDKLNIKCIPGIEIDCRFKGIDLHLLGYGVKDEAFNEIGDKLFKAYLALNEILIKKTEVLGFEINIDELNKLAKDGIYYGEIFAELLLNDERYKDNEILKPYREGNSRSDNPFVNFYWDYYAQGKPCYAEVEMMSLKDAIDMIHKFNGVAVLAHPGNNLKNRFEIFDEIVKEGIDGVEVFCSYHNEEVAKYFLNKAKEYDLLYTIGSDFHGKTKKSVFIGKTGCFINQNEIEENLRRRGLIQ